MKLQVKANQEAGQKMVIIFSSERYNKSEDENRANFDIARDHLAQNEIDYSIGEGSYKGDKEPCFICIIKNDNDIAVIKYLLQLFQQESALVRNSHTVYLYFPGYLDVEILGKKLVCVPEHEAMKQDSYTKHLGRYYIVK